NTWESCQTAPNPNPDRSIGHWIHYDLGASYVLTQSRIWNTNEGTHLSKGFRSVVVDFSDDGEDWTELGTYEFTQGTGEAVYEGFNGPDFGGQQARYVLLTATSNWGHPTCYGLAEVKFNLSPITIDSSLISPCGDIPCEIECRSPETAAAFGASSEELWVIWEESELASSYTFRYRKEGEDWILLTTEEPDVFLEMLEADTEYEYQIRANCEEEEAEFSESFYMQTPVEQLDCGLPVSVNGYFLADDFAIIAWNEVPDALNYRFRYRLAFSNDPWILIENDEAVRELEPLMESTTYEYQISVYCEKGWTDFSSTYYLGDQVTSVESLAATGLDFQLLPNPARDQVHLKINSVERETVELRVSNVMGQQVYRDVQGLHPGENQFTYSLRNLDSGIYFVSMQRKDGRQIQTKRLVVMGQ
ncbi:MAG: T9SS type A sorting domain-containing protein, partial [Bacteroidota bacterium]